MKGIFFVLHAEVYTVYVFGYIKLDVRGAVTEDETNDCNTGIVFLQILEME